MTFASAERAYLTQPEDWSCERCEDDDERDHDWCIADAEDAKEDAAIEAADARREAGDD